MYAMRELLLYLIVAAGCWRVFEKMGRDGWEGIVPFYNLYALFEELYGNGWKFLLLLIPVYNLYVLFRFSVDLSESFHQGTGFGIGLMLLPIVFYPILGFGRAVYGDGSAARTGDDVVSRGLDEFAGHVSGGPRTAKGSGIFEQIRELDRLRQSGILTEEEFQRKKEELLSRL